jgi:hypothetical protein
MNADTATSALPPRLTQRPLVWLLTAVALIAIAAAAVVLLRPDASSPAVVAPSMVVPAPASPAIEARYGIRVTQIGLTADGGLLDLRFVVIDAARAEQLSHGGVHMRLVVEDGNHLLDSEAMAPHGGALHVGSAYFSLFRNDGGLLGHGSRVTLLVGDLRLEHLVVL